MYLLAMNLLAVLHIVNGRGYGSYPKSAQQLSGQERAARGIIDCQIEVIDME